ncbi:MAG: putative quinol monooxygenase [Pseudomonadota bacterium]
MSKTIIARFQPKPGKEQQVENTLREMVPQTRREPGCLRYDFFRTSDVSGGGFCLIERYTDQAAIEAHRATTHYIAYRASIMDLLSAPIDVAILEPLDSRDI